MNNLVSIIVPIYQAEKYLHKCLDSIISQTYKNIEIILIVDGATDNSMNICEEYAEKDDRIVLKYQENAGVSITRNNGIDISNGEYIVFIDSDDYVEKNMIEELLTGVVENNCNIAICSLYIHDFAGGGVEK